MGAGGLPSDDSGWKSAGIYLGSMDVCSLAGSLKSVTEQSCLSA